MRVDKAMGRLPAGLAGGDPARHRRPCGRRDPFLTANHHVETGNREMAAGHHDAALHAYDQAARELPSSGGVHLDRGLALLAAGKLDKAREALLMASEPPATSSIRADAYYDLGVAFYREGDQKAGSNDHQEAQRLFREAADAFRHSLRARPGNHAAGWNLELALRRIHEQQQKQQQEEAKKKKQQQQQAQNQNQQQQNQQQQNQQQQNQQQQNQQQQNQQQQNQQAQNQQQQNQQGQGPQNQQPQQQQQQQAQNQQNHNQQGQSQQQQAQSQQQQNGAGSADRSQQQGQRLPGHVARVLDALRDGEQSLERYRARAQAAREQRQPEKDW